MPTNKRYWQQLCISAAIEENPERLAEIFAQLNGAMLQRQAELGRKSLKKQAISIEEIPVGQWIQ